MTGTSRQSRKSRAGHARKRPAQQFHAEQDEPLSAVDIRELKWRVRDVEDPVRYMLVSEFSRRFILHYNVSDDVFAMNHPSGGTLFKRRKVAERVRKLLGKGIEIVKYTARGGTLKRLSPYHDRWVKRLRVNA